MADRDAIVVGAGTAGCVVARRLAGAGWRVAVLEAGPGEPRPASITGQDALAAAEEPGWQWPGVAARANVGATPSRYRQGRGIGGGSAINAMLLAPGDRADYDRWEEDFGCDGWSSGEFAPWLQKASVDSDAMTVQSGTVTNAFAAAAVAAGHAQGGCSLEPDRLGMLEASLSLDGNARRSAFDRYLADVQELDALDLRTNTAVDRILESGGRATGVLLEDGTSMKAPIVIVCGGAVQTPRLLSQSGMTERPVGRSLRDHPSFVFTIALLHTDHTRHRRISQLLRWSSAGDDSGDLQAFVIDRVDGGDGTEPPMAAVVVGLMDVASTGSIHLGPAANTVIVTTGALTAQEDRRRLRAGVRHVRDLLAGPAMKDVVAKIYIDDQGTPVEDLDAMNDDQLDRWLIGHPGPFAHASGTCPMGPPDRHASVVSHVPEEAGRLIGYQGLHVIDASILPLLVKAGLQLPVTAVAERLAAGLLLQ